MGTGGEDNVNPSDAVDANGADDTSSQSHDPRLDIWKPEHSIILSEWADKAMCYQWLHFRSYIKYDRMNRMFTVPVIIISTLTGTANFATSQLNWAYTSSVIGAFNITAGIITTIQHFLKVGELNEAHKFASLSWDKFYRNIKVELSKSPQDRMSAYHMLKMYKEEFDRLMEISPVIGDDIISMFNTSFMDTTDNDRRDMFKQINKPEICGLLTPTIMNIYKEPPAPPVTHTTPPPTKTDEDIANSVIVKMREKSAHDKKVFDDFIEEFEKVNSRKPVDAEIISNLKDKIPEATIKKFLQPAIARPRRFAGLATAVAAITGGNPAARPSTSMERDRDRDRDRDPDRDRENEIAIDIFNT